MLIPKIKNFFIKLILTILISISITSVSHAESNLDFLNGQNPHESEFGKFVLTGEMNYPRYGHRAIVLQNGRVLIEGGSSTLKYQYTPMEIYNPISGNFTVMVTRNSNTDFIGILKSGKVILVGSIIQTYDPTKNILENILGDPIPEPLWNSSSKILDDDRVFIYIKKHVDSDNAFEETTKKEKYQFEYKVAPHEYNGRKWNVYDLEIGYIYSPTQNQVIQISDEESEKLNQQIFWNSFDYKEKDKEGWNFVYKINTQNYLIQYKTENKFGIYNISKNFIDLVEPMNKYRSGGYEVVALNDNELLISGGGDGNHYNPLYSDTEILNLRERKFYIGPNMHFLRAAHTNIKLKDGKILIIGGASNKTINKGLVKPAELFIPNYENKDLNK